MTKTLVENMRELLDRMNADKAHLYEVEEDLDETEEVDEEKDDDKDDDDDDDDDGKPPWLKKKD